MAGEGDAERLVVLLEARLTDFERNMAKAAGISRTQFSAIRTASKSATAQMEQDMLRSTTRINQALAATSTKIGEFGKAFAIGFAGSFSLKAAEDLIDSSIKIANALKVIGLSGTDLTKVYEALYASAQKNAAPFETLVALYSKAALQQKELGASTEDLLKFADNVAVALRVQGTDAQAASGALLQLSQALGTGVVRAQEFNSVLDQVPTIAQAAAAGLKEAGGSVATLRNLVVTGKVSSAAFFAAFNAGSAELQSRVAGAEITISQHFVRLQNVLVDAAGKFDHVADVSGAAGRGIEGLANIVQGLSNVFAAAANGPIGAFISKLSELNSLIQKIDPVMRGLHLITGENLTAVAKMITPQSGAANIDAMVAAIRKFEAAGETDLANGVRQELDAAIAKNAYPSGPSARGHGGAGAGSRLVANPVTLADYPVKPTAGTAGGSSSKNSFDSQVSTIVKRTAALQAETAAQSKLNPLVDDYGEAVATAKAKQDLLTAAQQAGVKITPDLQNSISALAESYGQATAEAARLSDSQREIREKAEESLRATRGVVQGVIDDLRQGKSAAEIFADALNKVADRLEDLALDGLFGKKGSTGGGLLGTLFSGLGSLLGGGGLSSIAQSAIAGSAGGLFDSGGYTGPGPANQPRGIVHAGEIVWSQDDIRRAGGVAAVEGMRLGLSGYARGGVVDGPRPVPARPQAMSPGDMHVHMGDTSIVVQGSADKDTVARMKEMLDERDRRNIAELPRRMIEAKRAKKLEGAFR